jgi:hypothetical protein
MHSNSHTVRLGLLQFPRSGVREFVVRSRDLRESKSDVNLQLTEVISEVDWSKLMWYDFQYFVA